MIPVTYNIRSMAVRKTTTIFTILGIALVVFVLAAALMLGEGIERTISDSGRRDNAIVISKGAGNELSSNYDKTQVGLVLAAPGVKRDDKSQPLGVGEVIVVIILEKLGTSYLSNVRLRGVSDRTLQFRDEAKIVRGRPARPGTDEVMIGKQLEGRFTGMRIGATFEIRKNRPVKVVGVFSSEGSAYESEIWADIDLVRTSFGRDGIVSSVRARLENPAKFDAFKAAVEGDKKLGLEAFRERDYFEKQSEGTAIFVKALGIVVSVFFAFGAMLGAAITMHAAVANRQREVGTLRALGFKRSSVLGSFLLESTMLALFGSLVGIGAASAMRWVKFSMMNFSGWNEIVFTFIPTGKILLISVIFGCTMGLLGGVVPAVRAARLSPVEAMRD